MTATAPVLHTPLSPRSLHWRCLPLREDIVLKMPELRPYPHRELEYRLYRPVVLLNPVRDVP